MSPIAGAQSLVSQATTNLVPRASSDGGDDSDSLPNIVSNFQDLSAVLSLFAADSVESKVSDPRANDLERMSSTWSVFGLMGAVRTYIKLVSGISSAEKAGVHIYGLGGYTLRKTNESLCVREIGKTSLKGKCSWQDDRKQLLGETYDLHTQWQRPFIIAMGYSQCPFAGNKAIREVISRALCAVVSTVMTCIPLLVLRRTVAGDTIDNLTLGGAIGMSLIGGCFLPLLLQRFNPVGVSHLRDSDMQHRFHNLWRDGDTVVTSSGSTMIMWQNPGEALLPRSGDLLWIRLLSTLSALVSVGAYLMNYIALGRVRTWRAYCWLGIQTFILAVRFVVWAVRPQLLRSRSYSLLFAATGSLVSPALEPDDQTCDRTLPPEVVHFALASAQSKVLNLGAPSVDNLQLAALNHLAGIAPGDILRAPYCVLEEHLAKGARLTAIRLPWSWVEEIYAAQGLILGPNPWSLGGLYLAAVVEGEAFLGLTTIHPRGASANGSHGEDDHVAYWEKDASLRDVVGVTCENYGMKGSLVHGTIADGMPGDHGLMDWHVEFREKVRECRALAVANGPAQQMMHVRNFGEGVLGTKRMWKTVSSSKEVLNQARRIAEKEKVKDHAKCKEFCTIFGF